MAARVLPGGSAQRGALGFSMSQHGGPGTGSSHPAPGTLSLTPGTARSLKHPLQQEAPCSQSRGQKDHRLKTLCHLAGKPKSSPPAHPCLQSIPAARRAGRFCHLSTPRSRKATQGPSLAGLGGPKETLEWVQIPQTTSPGKAGSSWCILPGVTVVAGGVISIPGAGASGISPNTLAEAATEGYTEWAERLRQTTLRGGATPAWRYGAFCPFFSAVGSCFLAQDEGTDCQVLRASQPSDQGCCCPSACTAPCARSSALCSPDLSHRCETKGGPAGV